MKLSAYGPFRYERQTNAETIGLFRQIEARRQNLEHGVGIYVFATRDSDAKLTPWYIGKSVKRDFGGRIMGHLNKGKFLTTIAERAGLSLYLIAALDDASMLRTRGALPASEGEEIGDLEVAWIASAAEVNPGLLNRQSRNGAQHVHKPEIFSNADQMSTRALQDVVKMLNLRES